MTLSKSRFGLGRKLLAVCLAFGLPIAVMSVLMTQAKLEEIEFAEKERMGDAMQRPLEELLQHLGRAERLWARGAGSAELAAERAAVEASLGALRAADQRYGRALQFTPEGLGLRGREQFTVQNLERKWQALERARAQHTPEAVPELDADSRGIIEHVRTMITHAGDASNLILDPDLDSYYLMDATLLALPQMEARIQELARQVDAAFGATGLAPRELEGKQRVRFATLAAFLKQSDWERVLASTNTAISEDPNFHGTSLSLRAALAPHLASSGRSVARVVEALEQLGGATGLLRPEFRADLEALDSELYAFHRAALDEEDRLLGLRIVDFQTNLRLGLALALGSVLVSVLLAFALSRNILGRLYRLSLATERFARGDLSARVGAAGGDEIGQLASSFDAMTTRIGGLTAEVRERATELEQINGSLEQKVLERTRELRQRNDAFRLILDHAHDGMLTVDLCGNVASERSAVVERWFGTPAAGVRLGAYLAAGQPTLAAEFELGLEQVAAGILPVDVCLDQLPHQLTRADRQLRISYQPLVENGSLSRILLIVSDVTAELEGRQALALQEDVLRMLQACQRDRTGFLSFFVDTRELVAKLTAPGGPGPAELRRAVHTLKGNSALFGVLTLSKLCHDVENNIGENRALLAADVARIRAAWSELSDSVAQIMGDASSQRVEVDDAEYATIVDSIARGTPRREILEAIARWRLEPVERRLQRLAEQSRALARKLGKEIEVTVLAHDVRLCAQTWAPLWSALSHAIRNAIDHGIDSADERAGRGVPRVGALRLETRVAEGRFLLEVGDDGNGVDWERVREKARAAGLAAETAEDLLEALFVDGISSKTSVTDISGRGVGMAALRQACRELGGDVEVDTAVGRGTTIRCSFPAERMGGELAASIAARAVAESLLPAESAPAELAPGESGLRQLFDLRRADAAGG